MEHNETSAGEPLKSAENRRLGVSSALRDLEGMRSEIEDWLVKKAGTWLRTRQDLTAERLERATRSKTQQLRRSLPLTCRVLEEAFKLGGCVIC